MLGHAPLSVFPLSYYGFDGSTTGGTPGQIWYAASFFTMSATMVSNPSFVVYFSTEELITAATDVPANTPMEGCLVTALNYQRSIVGGNYGLGRFQSGFGSMEIITSDGAKDDLFERYRPDGGRIALRIMESGGLLSAAFLAFDGVGVSWAISRDRGAITVKDNSYKLDVPAQRSVYAGTGALEGGTDLAGKRRPWSLGYPKNIPGVLVIPNENLYDLNDGRVEAVAACRDRGAALTFAADYASTALLRAASISSGQYGTCLAEGRARIGGSPSSQIRFDVAGDKAGGVFVSSTADIIQRLIADATTMAVPDGLVVETFAWLNTVQPAQIGYYLGPESTQTVAQCIEKLMEPLIGWGGCRAQGKFELGILLAPDSSEVPSFIYQEEEGDIIEIDRQPLPAFLSPPPTSWRVAYDRNWGPQTDIAGVVVTADPDLAAWLGKECRYALPSTPAVLETGQRPKEATVETYFRNFADAQSLSNRLLAMFRQNFGLYVFKVKDHVFVHEIGRAPKIYHSRFGLAAGRPLRNVSINDNTDNNTVELIGFG